MSARCVATVNAITGSEIEPTPVGNWQGHGSLGFEAVFIKVCDT